MLSLQTFTDECSEKLFHKFYEKMETENLQISFEEFVEDSYNDYILSESYT